MKILMVTTVERRTGATYYSRKLSRVLGADLVSAEQPLPTLLKLLHSSNADLCHVQFEYRTFGGVGRSLAILPLLTFLLSRRWPVIVTLHGIVTRSGLRGRAFGRLASLAYCVSLRHTATFAAAIIVHSELMRDTLVSELGVRKTVVIPHGSDIPSIVSEAIPSNLHLVFFGFIRPEKGLEDLLTAVNVLKGDYPGIRLTVAGAPVRKDEAEYLERLHRLIGEMNLESYVRFTTKFLTDREKEALVSRAAAIILPYRDQFIEVSGVVHDLAGFGVPIICSATPRFSELTDGVNCLKVLPDGLALARAIRRLFEDPGLRERLGKGIRRKAEAESWERVAERHLEIYRAVVLRTRRPHCGTLKDKPANL